MRNNAEIEFSSGSRSLDLIIFESDESGASVSLNEGLDAK